MDTCNLNIMNSNNINENTKSTHGITMFLLFCYSLAMSHGNMDGCTVCKYHGT